ncbi:hypothetical protein KIN20_023103 [Parelaphostrongylus tenuis]|uniref:Uncharacterized protein n=1 Tax=Parelaphostrongylus tenuis TaxID=148309 RepID=A0AAD5MRH6_PARTN|nr:hypothetical protein KIN20_023103 [Parelaphostrongylus tenuis]
MLESNHHHGRQSRKEQTNGKCAGVRTIRGNEQPKHLSVQLKIKIIALQRPAGTVAASWRAMEKIILYHYLDFFHNHVLLLSYE